MRILIAEDENEIAKALKVILERSRYCVDTVDNGGDALDYIINGNYDIAVLDIMMPVMDGLTVIQKIRARNFNIPVLLLTAKSEVEDRVAGLNAGADDYLPKPFATSEFIARIKALSRRVSTYTPDIVSLGNTSLDCTSFLLSTPTDSVKLNNKEFQMMEIFMRSPHAVFSAERFMERIWGYDSDSEIDVVWAYIAFLRKKLKVLKADIEIQTVRGAGYSLEELTWKKS
ncbi:MAG: response regulator transcription factor [Oscillospiraceae bacterium]|nr:response regulator transcription factor [Oscillospiraceae bacterium]